jgi:hypothetical protein
VYHLNAHPALDAWPIYMVMWPRADGLMELCDWLWLSLALDVTSVLYAISCWNCLERLSRKVAYCLRLQRARGGRKWNEFCQSRKSRRDLPFSTVYLNRIIFLSFSSFSFFISLEFLSASSFFLVIRHFLSHQFCISLFLLSSVLCIACTHVLEFIRFRSFVSFNV